MSEIRTDRGSPVFICKRKKRTKNRYKLYNGSFFFSKNYSNRCNLFICRGPFFSTVGVVFCQLFTSAFLHTSFCAGQSPEPTTATQWVASCSLTSQTAAPFKTSTTGWRRRRATSSRTASSSCWSATSVTWKPSVR